MKRCFFIVILFLLASCERDHNPVSSSASGFAEIQVIINDTQKISSPDTLFSTEKKSNLSSITQCEVRILKNDNTLHVPPDTLYAVNGRFVGTIKVKAENNLKVLCIGLNNGVVEYFGMDSDVDAKPGETVTATITGWNIRCIPNISGISPSPSIDGNYTVTWDTVPNALSYIIQEADNPQFSGSVVPYSTESNHYSFVGKSDGIIYYRIQSVNISDIKSGWSEVDSVLIQSLGSYEPNDTRAAAFQIVFSDNSWTSSGAEISSHDDLDWFQFTATASELVSITCEVTSTLDAKLVLYAEDPYYGDNWLVDIDNEADGGNEQILNYILPSSGTYYIGVGYYETITKTAQIKSDIGSYTLTVVKSTDLSPDMYEPNNTRATAYPIIFSDNSWTSSGAYISAWDDLDWFEFAGNAGEVISISCEVNSSLDPGLALYYDESLLLTVDDGLNGEIEQISEYTLPSSGTYYIGIGYFGAITKTAQIEADTGLYTLAVTKSSSTSLNNVIAFASDRDGNLEIYSMDLNGSNQTRLTYSEADDLFPSWSPNGSMIVYTSFQDVFADIYVMGSDGSSQTRLTYSGADDAFPSWSPDGSTIAFTSYRDGYAQLYIMYTDGSSQTRLTYSGADDVFPSWSPDGSMIAFTSYRDGNGEIYVIDLNDFSQIRLTNNSTDDAFPSWSPDGSMIAFTSYRDGNGEIYVINLDNFIETKLTNNPDDDELPLWSPDGFQIVFTSYRDGNGEIYVMDSNGSSQTRITNNPANDTAFSLSKF
ncbi:pre-peptidase C-terminal domain-containing protein [Candidatus Latescibacterota bacterium]